MWGQEIFLYGGPGWIDGLKSLKSFYGSAMMATIASGGTGGRSGDQQMITLLRDMSSGPGPIRVPELVVGFRLNNPAAATPALKRLETLFREQLRGVPELQQRLQWQKLGGSDFLVLSLDRRAGAWQEIPCSRRRRVKLDNLLAKLKAAKLTISLGVRDRNLILAIGESTAVVTKLGQGKTLGDRAEFRTAGQADRPAGHRRQLRQSSAAGAAEHVQERRGRLRRLG